MFRAYSRRVSEGNVEATYIPYPAIQPTSRQPTSCQGEGPTSSPVVAGRTTSIDMPDPEDRPQDHQADHNVAPIPRAPTTNRHSSGYEPIRRSLNDAPPDQQSSMPSETHQLRNDQVDDARSMLHNASSESAAAASGQAMLYPHSRESKNLAKPVENFHPAAKGPRHKREQTNTPGGLDQVCNPQEPRQEIPRATGAESFAPASSQNDCRSIRQQNRFRQLRKG